MGRDRILCFLFLLSLSVHGTSNIKILNTIRDLADNNIDFGKTPPRHGLKLLYWLAHSMAIDQNDVMQLEIMGQRKDYDIHPFKNIEQIFSSGHFYYTLGNLGKIAVGKLPCYVTKDYNRNIPNSNRDRIVIQTLENTPTRVTRLYITQHPHKSNSYDRRHTYEISSQLIREIQNMELEEFLRQIGYPSEPVDDHPSNFKGNPPDNPPDGGVGSGTEKREATEKKGMTQKHSRGKHDGGTGSYSHSEGDAAKDAVLATESSEMGHSWSRSLLVLVVLALISAVWLRLTGQRHKADPPVNQVRVQPLVSK